LPVVLFYVESLFNPEEEAMKVGAASMLLAVMVLAACGGGDGGGGDDGGGGGSPPGNLVTGSVMKGPFTAGTITGLEFTTNGATLGTAQIQGDGSFELDVGAHTGPLLLRVDGGTYMDEVTGVQAQTEPMFGMVPAVGTGATANVTPLTSIFAQVVFARVEGPPFDPFNTALTTTTNRKTRSLARRDRARRWPRRCMAAQSLHDEPALRSKTDRPRSLRFRVRPLASCRGTCELPSGQARRENRSDHRAAG
jgi:hypothetical protein